MKEIIHKYRILLHAIQQLAEIYCVVTATFYISTTLFKIATCFNICIESTQTTELVATVVLLPAGIQFYKWFLVNLTKIAWTVIIIICMLTVFDNLLHDRPFYVITLPVVKKLTFEVFVCVMHHPNKKLIFMLQLFARIAKWLRTRIF